MIMYTKFMFHRSEDTGPTDSEYCNKEILENEHLTKLGKRLKIVIILSYAVNHKDDRGKYLEKKVLSAAL